MKVGDRKAESNDSLDIPDKVGGLRDAGCRKPDYPGLPPGTRLQN